jgi:hypothetical protein
MKEDSARWVRVGLRRCYDGSRERERFRRCPRRNTGGPSAAGHGSVANGAPACCASVVAALGGRSALYTTTSGVRHENGNLQACVDFICSALQPCHAVGAVWCRRAATHGPSGASTRTPPRPLSTAQSVIEPRQPARHGRQGRPRMRECSCPPAGPQWARHLVAYTRCVQLA